VKRFQAYLDERHYFLLERMAKKRKLSTAMVLREAVKEYVDARWRVAK
jgi:predicted transcriptional regulator